MLHLRAKAALGRLGRHLDDVAFNVHLPAVIEAAQAVLLVAAVRQRCAAMRAMQIERAQAPGRIAKHDEVFAEQANAQRRAVRLFHFLGEARGQPIATHHPPHRRIAFDATEQVVFFSGHHRRTLRSPAASRYLEV